MGRSQGPLLALALLALSACAQPASEVTEAPGRDVAYVSEEARTFYLKVESANEDWKVVVDEGFHATIERQE